MTSSSGVSGGRRAHGLACGRPLQLGFRQRGFDFCTKGIDWKERVKAKGGERGREELLRRS